MKYPRKYNPKLKDVVKLNEYIEKKDITVVRCCPTKAQAEGRVIKSKRRR